LARRPESFRRYLGAPRTGENRKVRTREDAVLDVEELRRLTMDDRQLMIEILQALIEDASRQTGMLETAVLDQDAPRSARIARYASRACANVGATAAAEAFGRLGRHAASREFAACRSTLAAARAEIERLRVEAARI
jgi:HPt (histidine-containing phosphotransfer) domain-containing protein